MRRRITTTTALELDLFLTRRGLSFASRIVNEPLYFFVITHRQLHSGRTPGVVLAGILASVLQRKTT
jgi:hypothetical protein